jgi:hypothetical protein
MSLDKIEEVIVNPAYIINSVGSIIPRQRYEETIRRDEGWKRVREPLTIPLRKHPYDPEYQFTDDPRFHISENANNCILVSQGGVKSSIDARPLQSMGFATCRALAIKNLRTGETILMHIEDLTIGDSQYKALNEMKQRASPDDILVGVFIRGSDSAPIPTSVISSMEDTAPQIRDEYGNYRVVNVPKVELLPTIIVDSSSMHWDIVVDPEKDEILVHARVSNEILTYPLTMASESVTELKLKRKRD